MSSEIFHIADFVNDIFYPCIGIGAILPAGAAVLAAFFNVSLRALGMLVDD